MRELEDEGKNDVVDEVVEQVLDYCMETRKAWIIDKQVEEMLKDLEKELQEQVRSSFACAYPKHILEGIHTDPPESYKISLMKPRAQVRAKIFKIQNPTEKQGSHLELTIDD